MEPMWGGCVCVDDAARAWHQGEPVSVDAVGLRKHVDSLAVLFTPENRDNGDMVRVYYNDEKL